MNNNYQYWSDYVLSWIKSPFGPGYLLNTYPTDLSRDYVPEPYWGNIGVAPLYSVCINLNPGKGEENQTLSNKSLKSIKRYQDLFSLLPKTNKWHSDKRAAPIGNAIKAVFGLPAGNIDNHLSIELIPWHTEHATPELGYWNYVSDNLKDIFEHSILFAYEESKRAIGPLNSKVILRFSGNSAEKLFKLFQKEKLISCYSKSVIPMSNPNTHVLRFIINPYQDCEFIAVWRSKGHGLNNFPSSSEMNELFSII